MSESLQKVIAMAPWIFTVCMLKEIDYDEKKLILLMMTAAEKMYTKIVGNPNMHL